MPRTQDAPRPVPDASFQSTDPTEFVLRPDPAELDRRQREAGEAAAIRQNLSDRDRVDAAEYNVPETAWKLMSDVARQAVIADYNQRNAGAAGVLSRTIDHGTLGSTRSELETQYERAIRELDQDKAEARQFTILCRPVVQHPRWGRIHQAPGIVKVSRRQVGKKLAQGFTYYPEADFIPQPTVTCEMCQEANVDPPFRGYPDRDDSARSVDIERHQKARHPEEFQARDRQQNRQGQDNLTTLLLGQGKLLEELMADRRAAVAAAKEG